MKTFLLGGLCLCSVLFSCKQERENNTTPLDKEQTVTKLTESDISKLKLLEYVLDTKTEIAIEKWGKYKELEELVANVKKGDLSFFKDNSDAIKTFLKELKETIPDTVNTPSVEARLTALETKLYKLENFFNLETTTKEDLSSTIKEFLESVSNLNLQMNKKLEKDSQNIEKP